jgi:hypothetical protein
VNLYTRFLVVSPSATNRCPRHHSDSKTSSWHCQQIKIEITRGTDPYLVKDILQFVLCERAALHILDSAQVFGQLFSVGFRNRYHLLSCQLLSKQGWITNVNLGTNNEAWYSGTMLLNIKEKGNHDPSSEEAVIGWRCCHNTTSDLPYSHDAARCGHGSRMFANEAGEVTERQNRNTSVWGYDSGLRRS